MKNISALAKMIQKRTSIKNQTGVSVGFSNPTKWVSTGNYTLNYLMSGRFDRGVPLGKVAVFAGDSGAGKSYIVSGNIIKDAQRQGIYCVVIDTENALDEDWMRRLGVDTSEDKLHKLNMSLIDDIAKQISEITIGYREMYGDLPREERPGLLIVIDSLGMAMTPTEADQFQKGDMKGDMGRKAKQLKALVTNCVNAFGDLNIGLVATNHTYASQDMFSPDPKISGGSGFVYASSMVVSMALRKLKEDAEGAKTSKVNGIRASCKVVKTRYNKPFEEVEIKIPYETGMNPYSGLTDLFENMEVLRKTGNRLAYVDVDTGEEITKFRKAWDSNENGCLDLIMEQFYRNPVVSQVSEDENYEDEHDIPDNIEESEEE